MDSDQESSECPLCLEILEADDLNFYPCTCCYQICRFCWHRIRTDENGLCPACRKPYSENPAQFKPLTEEEIQQVKRDRKLKESNKKPKVTESRKHLANLRVVQRNLVFVNGLPARLADTELLRRNDHFGKYGKIVKLVTSPAHNGQVNSICVYITYSRSEEALRAIQSLCNYHVDGRTLKATLGTTKYCSRYLKGATCQKTDCLYLHEPGDPSASFTKEQMQQGLHLDYERKLMEQYTNKNPTATTTTTTSTSSTTPKNGRSLPNGHKNESSPQRRKHAGQPTPLLPPSHSTITTNGNSDFESGDENPTHTTNGYPTETFNSTTAIHVDSDSTSTSSQTSSEHEPQMVNSTTLPPNTFHQHWPDERPIAAAATTTTYLPVVNHPFASSQQINVTATATVASAPTPLDSTSNGTTTVKSSDPLPEYKLFGSNTPSIHTILFGNSEHSSTLNRPLFNTHDHDVREIEKKLMESSLSNDITSSSLFAPQENDELGFDPCSVFMSALASDIEDERRPSPSILSSRLTNNYQVYPQSLGQMNTGWYPQGAATSQIQTSYPSYHEAQQIPLHSNGTTNSQKLIQPQQRFPPSSFNGTSARPMWNGVPTQQQYPSQIGTRLDYPPGQQRLGPSQISPSNQYTLPTKSNFTSNNTVTPTNLANDGWMNSLYIDPAIISFGNKLEPSTTSGQWTSSTQSQGSSTMSSGTNLISTSRWSQNPSQASAYANHMISNGIYSNYSTTSGLDDGNRS